MTEGHGETDPGTGMEMPLKDFKSLNHVQLLEHFLRGVSVEENGWGKPVRAWEKALPYMRSEILRRMK